MPRPLTNLLRDTWPAFALPLSLAALWLWLRLAYPGPATGPFLAWTGFAFLLTTLTVILWTASARPKSAFEPPGMLIWKRFALLGDAAGLVLVAVALVEHLLTWPQALKLYLLLIAWSALWTGCAWALRRWGPGVSIGLSVLFATALMAGPVLFVPVIRGIGTLEQGQPDKPYQANAVAVVGAACPLMGALDAMHPDLQINWATLPGMYVLSGLGQDIPMQLPAWWVCSLAYGTGALILMGAGKAAGGRRF